MNASVFPNYVVPQTTISSVFYENYSSLESEDKPPIWKTWVIGLVFVSICSWAAPLLFMFVPCLAKSLYDRIMTFLIALGVGTMSGSTMFIMLPKAFQITQLEDYDYHVKSSLIIAAVYLFLTIDRVIQYILEFRRRRISRRQVHHSTIISILDNPKFHRKKSNTINHSDKSDIDSKKLSVDCNQMSWNYSGSDGKSRYLIDDETTKRETADISEGLDAALSSNALARSLSSRRKFAILNVVDGVIVRRSSYSGNERHKNLTYDKKQSEGTIPTIQLIKAEELSEKTSPASSFRSSKSSNEEVLVDIRVMDKKVIDRSTVEVASVAYMIIIGSSGNNFVDAMGLGAAFSDSIKRGISLGLAQVTQQLPQELGVLAILTQSGLGLKKAILINLIPIFLSYTGFIGAIFMDNINESYDQYIFSVSSGMYLYIFLGTLIPEIREAANELIKEDLKESVLTTVLQYLGFTGGIIFMFFMSRLGDD